MGILEDLGLHFDPAGSAPPAVTPTSSDPLAALDLSSVPYQDRADYQAEQVNDSGLPDLQKDSGQVIQKVSPTAPKSGAVVDLTSILSNPKMQDMAAQTSLTDAPASNPLNDYQTQLAAAQEQQRKGMVNSGLRGSSTDFLNAGLAGMGIDKQLTPGYGDARLNEMNDLGLKNLQQNLTLPGQVAASEKAKIDLTDEAEMNDKNSNLTKLYNATASDSLGIDPSKFNGLSAAQTRDAIGTLDKIVDAKMKSKDAEQKFQLLYQEGQDKIEATRGEAAAKNKLAEVAMENKQSVQDRQLASHVSDKLMSDPTYKQLNNITTQADTLKNDIDAAVGNPAANATLKEKLIPYLMGSSRVPKQVMDVTNGDPSFLGKAQQFISTATLGTLNQSQAQNLKNLVDNSSQSAQKAKQQMTVDASKRLNQLNPRIDISSAYSLLTGGDSYPGSTSSGSVKMTGPDGQTRMIPQDRVQDALNAGGKMAQ